MRFNFPGNVLIPFDHFLSLPCIVVTGYNYKKME